MQTNMHTINLPVSIQDISDIQSSLNYIVAHTAITANYDEDTRRFINRAMTINKRLNSLRQELENNP